MTVSSKKWWLVVVTIGPYHLSNIRIGNIFHDLFNTYIRIDNVY